MADGTPKVATTPAGATMQPMYMGRTMKCYPVHDSEMEMLGTLNTQATTYFAAAAAAVGYAVSIWVNAAFYDKLTEMARLASIGLAPVVLAAGLVFLYLGIHASGRRDRLWSRIKAESGTIVEAVQAD